MSPTISWTFYPVKNKIGGKILKVTYPVGIFLSLTLCHLLLGTLASVVGSNKYYRPLVRDYSRFSEEKLLNYLLQVDWTKIVSESVVNADKQFSRCYNINLNYLIKIHASLKPITKRKSKM